MPNLNPYEELSPTQAIKAMLDIIHEPGEVFEVRVPKAKAGTLSGYFDDTSKAAIFINRENGKHQSIYATVNPVKPALLARMENRIAISQVTTTDAEIEKRRWFLLDFDPKRPTGISSTDAEMGLAKAKAEEVHSWLASIGWPEPIQACSGNGWHLMYRVDEPNDDDTRLVFEFATKMLSTIFSDQGVDIDVSVFNASRVWKVYGTKSMKGSSTEERPHRTAYIHSIPDTIEVVDRAKLDNVARPLRESKSDEFKDMTGEYIGDMVKWLADRGQTVVSGPRPMFGSEGQKWVISRCPFDHNHVNPIVGLVNNRPVFRCLHNSCSSYRWKEFREKIDPTYKDPDTIFTRLKEWCEGSDEEIDKELVQSACATGKKLSGILGRVKKDVPRNRFLILEGHLKDEHRRFIRETIGENNEKGNIVGLINRTRTMQADGNVPMYWIAEYDHRIRVGDVGDVSCEKLSEAHEIALMVKFHSLGDSWVKQTHAGQVIRHLAESYRVNPLRKFLSGKTWDGEPRLDTWLPHYMGTKDSKYTRAIGRKWFISAVARGMDPGCQADHMLIFEGKQGIGKSQAARIIGGDFYCEFSGNIRGPNAQRDLTAVIIGKMIVELSELATIKRAEIEALKAILTTTVDDVRLSYERDAKSYPRTCVFIGTTNQVGQAYIADLTGARRFWPTVVGEVHAPNTALLKRDVEQLWAEAVEAYQNGEDWYTVPVEEVELEQQDRQVTLEDSEPWHNKLRAAMTDPDAYSAEVFVAVPEFVKGQPTGGHVIRAGAFGTLLGVAIGIDTARQGPNDVLRAKNVLTALGFKKIRPSRPWMGSSYAWEINRETAGHMWSSMIAASKAARFPSTNKQSQEEA